jgi:predicted HTH domain antitoxin
MQVTLNIPDELAAQMVTGGADISRAALEALAVEGYRTERLSESEIRQLLGFETRMEVHAFLKERGAWMHYSLDDLERDRESALRIRSRQEHPSLPDKPLAE